MCLCPFHGNTHTGSFSVSRRNGKFICFNAACAETGSLVELVKRHTGRNEFEARRLILKAKSADAASLSERLKKALEPKVEWTEFSAEKIEQMHNDLWDFPEVVQYLTEERGFEEETLEFFKIGYSLAKHIIAVPMYNSEGLPVGVIGRPASVHEKFFKNSKKLPTSKTLWNIHRAKRGGDTVIVTEASFDAMRVHQAGFPNVVACLGGNFSPYHIEQINRFFKNVIIMTDFDRREKYIYKDCKKCFKKGMGFCIGHNPGRDLGNTIASTLKNKRILWASYDTKIVYPHGAKDAGDLLDEEIRQCINNSVPNFIYEGWKLY